MDTICLILTGDSAIAFWSCFLADKCGAYLTPAEANRALASACKSIKNSDIAALRNSNPVLQHFPEQLDLLVPSANDHRTTPAFRLRTWSRRMPRGMLVDSGLGLLTAHGKQFRILTVSAEMAFLAAAAHLDIAELVEFGCELCGSYAIAELAKHGFIQPRPRTTPKRIDAFLSGVESVPGIRNARRALPLVVPESRSPKETQIAMLVSMPRRFGGLAHTAPVLNRPVDALSPTVRQVLGGKHCIPDMSWPKLVLEYDSREFHTPVQAEHDARKRNVYQMLGYDVVTLTYGQLANLDTFTAIIEGLGPTVVKRQRPATPEQLAKRRAFHKWLLHGKRYPRFTDPLLAGVGTDGSLPEIPASS